MTTVEALKELFTALGGSEEDVKAITTNPEMVHALAGIAGSAIELPKVTAADAGDILAVDESGKWAKAAAPTGGMQYKEYIVTKNGVNYSLPSGVNATTIQSDITNGYFVVLKYGGRIYYLRHDQLGATTNPCEFDSIEVNGITNKIIASRFIIPYNSNTVNYLELSASAS